MPRSLLLLPALLAVAVGSLAVPPPDETWWSFRLLRAVAVPKADAWCRGPIDAFLRDKQKAAGLTPAPEADRRTLLRRLSLDLIGLPPTPEHVADFLADPHPDAYERQVERLLASPAFGERQARYWLDVVHFAETHGHDQDRIRPNAFRYRDYLIDAFNRDTPYARFVSEQLAADVLFSDAPERLPALGFLSAGPWDESSLRDIREDSIDRKIGHYLDRDDMAMTVMTTFQSLSVHCARCHDHKLDPISTADHYALQAVFAGIGRGERTYDVDGATASRRLAIQQGLATLDRGELPPHNPADLAALETAARAGAGTWNTLRPTKVLSSDGATLTSLDDGSVRSEGKRPERDTVTAIAPVRGPVTAIRLEVLTDPALPHQGPGRQDNGNLHLSEIRLSAGPNRPLTLRNPVADYDQPSWTAAHTIDGNAKTAWGIYPQVGKPHEVTYDLATPLPEGDHELTWTLDQHHGGGHLIGRFRLSTTASPVTVTVKLPGRVADILRLDPKERSEVQQRELTGHLLRHKLMTERASLPAPRTAYAAGPDFLPDGNHKPIATPRPVHVLKRGDIRKPGDEATPGTVSCLPGLPGRFEIAATAPEGERRAALARWITRADNPLTWRSIVNRVWHQHFGRGLVDTPGEFGRLGSQPSHSELLDWLATTFRDEGGSLKSLHRRIVTSSAYRQSSQVVPSEKDTDNRLLARMPRSRLDSEQVRDAVLMASGRLDRTMAGPSDRQFGLRPGIHVTPIVEYGTFDWDRPQGHRRSVYRFVFRTLPDPLVECLDGADASQLTPVRNVSITAPQALALLNNEFVLVHARALAGRLGDDPIVRLCRIAWQRDPSESERTAFAEYARKHGLANLCRVMLNSNEFLFAD